MSTQQLLRTSTGNNMPGIIYGTAWKKANTADLVEKALLIGFRGIDTAAQPKHYEEALVGAGIQNAMQQGIAREDIYLQTKFTPFSSQDPEQLPYDKSAPIAKQVADSFASSLQNLQTDYVDCLILHSPLSIHVQTMQAWQAMESIHQDGGARTLGISNCYDLDVMKDLYADARVKPVIVQNRFYKDTGYEVQLRRWCARRGIVFQSFWSLTANMHILSSDIIQNLAVQHGKSPAQIFFRYLSQSGIVPLTGTTSEQHMRDDLGIFEFTLPVDEIHELDLLLGI